MSKEKSQLQKSQLQEWRDLPEVELVAKHKEFRKQAYAIRNERRINKKLEKPHLKSKMRRDVARLLTVLSEKRLQNA
jgi:ribosomal protein L29